MLKVTSPEWAEKFSKMTPEQLDGLLISLNEMGHQNISNELFEEVVVEYLALLKWMVRKKLLFRGLNAEKK